MTAEIELPGPASEDLELAAIVHELYNAFERLGAPPELLSIVGSWTDTLDSATVLRCLRAYNANGTMFTHVIARAD